MDSCSSCSCSFYSLLILTADSVYGDYGSVILSRPTVTVVYTNRSCHLESRQRAAPVIGSARNRLRHLRRQTARQFTGYYNTDHQLRTVQATFEHILFGLRNRSAL